MTTEKKQLKEQIAIHTYTRPLSPAPSHAPGGRRMPNETGAREIHSAAGNTRTRQRVVTKPGTVQPGAGERFVNRRNRIYSARAKAQPYTHVVPRTLAQTGVQAPRGIKRSLPQYHATPIPRRSGRRRRGFAGLLWKVFGIFALLLMIVLGTNFALTSSAFRVAQVSVVGTHNPSLVQSIQHMGMQGQNIFLIDVVALTTRIDMVPLVASARLEKQWPNQLEVMVTERTPILLWQTRQGVYSVDKYGVVIAPASETTGVDSLVTIMDMRGCRGGYPQGTTLRGCPGSKGHSPVEQSIHPGVRLNQADIAFAMAVLERLPKLVSATDFTLLYDYTPPARVAHGQNNLEDGSYVVESKAGWLAYLGNANDPNPLDNRLFELQQILALAQQQQLNLATVDLRFGLRPVYTLKG